MDVCESGKHTAVDTPRPPLLPAERNSFNAAASRHRPRKREVSSRYKWPTPCISRRCPSPNTPRTLPTNSQVDYKRAQSAERRRPLTPPSPSSPCTPVQDSSVDLQLPSRKISSWIPESLWPSTMRSLNVPFQSDIISIPISKKEKPITNASSDRTLRPSSNVAHKQAETPARSRKPTPERKRSPLKGKSAQDQSENAKPTDGLHTRLIDQHRWPSRLTAKSSSNSSKKGVDLTDKSIRVSSTPIGIGLSSYKRTSPPCDNTKPSRKSVSEAAKLSYLEDIGKIGSEANSADDTSLQVSRAQKLVATSLSDRMSSITPTARSQSLPTSGTCPPSPNRTSVSRGVSPCRARPSTPPSRGVSPSRTRSSTISSQSNSSTSVLSFIVDVKKGKKGSSYIEDAHQIRLLYNRYLQWRFANARVDAVLFIQKVTVEQTLFNVWNSTLALWDSVNRKRIDLQQLKLDLKLSAILNDQMAYLDDWALLERDHISSLAGALEDLEATTLHLPVTGGAKADIDSLKVGICSAVDVMQAIGSSICSLHSRVEGVNALVSDLAVVAAEEKAMLDQCEALLASTAALQVEEYSFRTHLIQMKHVLENQLIMGTRTHQWP